MGVWKLRILPKKTNILFLDKLILKKTDTSLCFAWSYIFTHEINCNFILANEQEHYQSRIKKRQDLKTNNIDIFLSVDLFPGHSVVFI